MEDVDEKEKGWWTKEPDFVDKELPLPPIDQTPTLVVRFTSKASERLIHLCEERWQQHGLIVLERHRCDSSSVILVLTATQEACEAQAERLHLIMPTNDDANAFIPPHQCVMEYFSRAERERFIQQLHSNNNIHPCGGKKHGFLFHSAHCAFLVNRIFRSVTVLNDEDSDGIKDSNPLSTLLEKEYHADFRVRWLDVTLNAAGGDGDGGTVTSSMRSQHAETSDTLWHVLTNLQVVDSITCIHQPTMCYRMVMQTAFAPLWHIITPDNVLHVQEYLGYEVAFYFAWIGFLTQWYTIPASLGILVYVLRVYRGDTIDEDELVPFFGLVCFVWAILFLNCWEREENRLAYQWGTYSLTNYERTRYFSTRAEFRGYLRISPVTGEYETYYPPSRRRLKYVVSALVTMAMLGVAFLVMILSLNLQGYINPNHNPERWHGSHNAHPFHFPAWADLAEQGNVFDARSSWRSLIPVVVHVMCISTLNSLYRVIAEQLTHYENHQTELSHINSLVLKRFLFEAFDCYVALFYLAFYERDIIRLRMELIGIFQMDTLRRVLLECVVPLLWQSYQQGHFVLPKFSTANSFAQDYIHRPTLLREFVEELKKEEYDQFDDYMEIVIQLGCELRTVQRFLDLQLSFSQFPLSIHYVA
jgi:hypothetical protein